MRKPALMPTARQRMIPCAVLVGGDDRIVRACRTAVAQAAAARLERTSVEEVANIVAKWQPFALLVPEELYEFDPEEFDALARTVNAMLIRLTPDIDDPGKLAELGAALRLAYDRGGL